MKTRRTTLPRTTGLSVYKYRFNKLLSRTSPTEPSPRNPTHPGTFICSILKRIILYPTKLLLAVPINQSRSSHVFIILIFLDNLESTMKSTVFLVLALAVLGLAASAPASVDVLNPGCCGCEPLPGQWRPRCSSACCP